MFYDWLALNMLYSSVNHDIDYVYCSTSQYKLVIYENLPYEIRHNLDIVVVRASVSRAGNQNSIPARLIPHTLNMVVVAFLLNTGARTTLRTNRWCSDKLTRNTGKLTRKRSDMTEMTLNNSLFQFMFLCLYVFTPHSILNAA